MCGPGDDVRRLLCESDRNACVSRRRRRYSGRMPPTPLAPGSVRPAAAINEEIRSLAATASGRDWTAEERARYDQLLAEWEAAIRAEIVEAA